MKKVVLSVMIFSSVVFSCKKEDAKPDVLKVYELTEKVNGLSYGDLDEIASKWLIGVPPDKSAASDEVGVLSGVNNQPNSNVTILAFNFGGKSERTLTIPSSKPVYVPILGYTYWYFESKLHFN